MQKDKKAKIVYDGYDPSSPVLIFEHYSSLG